MNRFLLVAAFAFSLPALASDPKTERLWKAKCGSCHGAEGKGDTEQGKKMAIADMSTAAWQSGITDDKMKASILGGVKEERKGVKKEMDPFKDKLQPDQVTALIAHVRSLKK